MGLLTQALQLALVVLVIYLYQIEEQLGLVRIAPMILGGFIVHALLPLKWRMPFFLFLSLAGIVMVLGYPYGLVLIGLGLLLIGICHLPVAFSLRMVLLLSVVAVLAAIRAKWIILAATPISSLVIPVLGAMFMFRLIIYFYDLRHERKPATIWERLSYFFLLPNVCFLLFPVIDYQTFRRTYYDQPDQQIYQKGIGWIFRGVTHLLLYRLVYHHLLPSVADVTNLATVVQYMGATYLLYLRISGQFHIIIGILCLFGFNLPETHHLYYLATSFNDYWRRINIYWKDFMMKIFYYPLFMQLRKYSMMTALAGATIFVFFGTWALHAYQWFWLQGHFPLTGPDALFWGILGILVVINALYEAKRGRKRTLKQRGWDLRKATVHAAKVVGMFLCIMVLWSLWSSSSLGEWIAVVSQATQEEAATYGLLVLALILLVGIGVAIQYGIMKWEGVRKTLDAKKQGKGARGWAPSFAALILVILIPLQEHLGIQTGEWMASIQQERHNEQDKARIERGYYEGLLNTGNYASALWLARAEEAPADWQSIRQLDLSIKTDSLLDLRLVSSQTGIFRRAYYQTNRWGMRDQEYLKEKPDSTFRIAVLGSSYEMGSGVANQDIYEADLEERLNREKVDSHFSKYEILNFAVNGYSIVHNVVLAEERIFDFQPDLVFLSTHSAENRRLVTHLRRIVERGMTIPYPGLQAIIEKAGVDSTMVSAELERRLSAHIDEIIQWGLVRIAKISREHGAIPVYVVVPRTDEIEALNNSESVEYLAEKAGENGYVTLNLEGTYQGYSQADLVVAPWDVHPNALGHRLISKRLFEELKENEHLLNLMMGERDEVDGDSLLTFSLEQRTE